MDIIGKKSLESRSGLVREEQGSGSMFNGNKNRWRKEERDFDKDSKYVKVIIKEEIKLNKQV